MPTKCDAKCSDTHTMHLYEYAVVRFVPSIERGETVNIGLVMMCKRRRWVRARFVLNPTRILALFPDADIETLRRQIVGFERVVAGDTNDGGDIAALEPHERFRWLTAVRSASIQTERPHAGLCRDLDDTFARLVETLIL